MSELSLIHIQIASIVLFSIGIYGVLSRRNAVLILLAIELMLNAVNLNLIGVSVFLDQSKFLGHILVIFIITVAAAEVGLALAIVLKLYKEKRNTNVDELDVLKW
jgi:NADH:ubiquinone oxidoreductase subunit K